MSLLQLEQISMRYASGRRERVALRDVSLEIEPGELVAVWGQRRSGRTTLLRVAAGTTAPTRGTVCFNGVSLTRRSMLGVPDGIGYAMTHFHPIVGGSVLEQVAAPLLARGYSILRAQKLAYRLLTRADVAACATLKTTELDCAETMRAAIARALITRPSLLLVDQPIDDLPPAHMRDGLLDLLHSIARREAIAVMLTTDEGAGLAGVDRALALDRGALRGTRPPARVIPLRSRAPSERSR